MKDFAKIVRFLHELTRKKKKWEWKIRQEKSFEMLKKQFTMKLVLLAPDLNKEIKIGVDTSDYAMEGVLSMKCSN